jgi:membrane associated rhomboid family serine protease
MEFSITLAIVIITCLVSFGGFAQQKIVNDLIFYPPAIAQRKQYYRFITHGFIHADIAHLAFNMIALYSFGGTLERQIFSFHCLFGFKGGLMFLLLYLGGLIIASLPDYFKYRDDPQFRSLGASGAVSAVIFSSIVLVPKVGIGVIFIPGVDIPGYIFGVIYLAISAYLNKRGGSHINHGAHLWGAIFGLVFTIVAVSFFSHINVWENFVDQINASKPYLPSCNE